MAEIILTLLCLILTVFFIVVLSKIFQANVETNPKQLKKEDVISKKSERGTRSIDRSDEDGSDQSVRKEPKIQNKSDDKRNRGDSKGKKNDDKENNKKQNKEKSDDMGNQSTEAKIELKLQTDIGIKRGMKPEYKKFENFVDKEDLSEKMAKEGTANGLFKYIRKSLDPWKKRALNVAVTGNAGAGKSSLINALRNLNPKDQGAAEVGVVETTTNEKKYTFPNNEHVALWDLPGVGTQTFAKDKYLKKMDFSRFDVVIIVTATRFTENDLWLAKKSIKFEKSVIFVRTKIDIDLMNSKRDDPDGFCETKMMDEIKQNIAENLKEGDLSNKASGPFLVSSADQGHDFQKLKETLKGLLDKRGEAVSFFLQEYVEEAVRSKQKLIKKDYKVWRYMGTVAVVFAGLKDGLSKIVRADYNHCLKQFCLDDQSLDKLSEELSISKKDIKKSLVTYEILGSQDTVLLGATEKSHKKSNPFRGKWTFLVPVVRMIIHTSTGYQSSKECLKTMCDQMARDELRLISKRLGKLEKELNPLKT